MARRARHRRGSAPVLQHMSSPRTATRRDHTPLVGADYAIDEGDEPRRSAARNVFNSGCGPQHPRPGRRGGNMRTRLARASPSSASWFARRTINLGPTRRWSSPFSPRTPRYRWNAWETAWRNWQARSSKSGNPLYNQRLGTRERPTNLLMRRLEFYISHYTARAAGLRLQGPTSLITFDSFASRPHAFFLVHCRKDLIPHLPRLSSARRSTPPHLFDCPCRAAPGWP